MKKRREIRPGADQIAGRVRFLSSSGPGLTDDPPGPPPALRGRGLGVSAAPPRGRVRRELPRHPLVGPVPFPSVVPVPQPLDAPRLHDTAERLRPGPRHRPPRDDRGQLLRPRGRQLPHPRLRQYRIAGRDRPRGPSDRRQRLHRPRGHALRSHPDRRRYRDRRQRGGEPVLPRARHHDRGRAGEEDQRPRQRGPGHPGHRAGEVTA